MEEKLEKEEVEEEGNDRRDFLKAAAKVAGAVALISAIGNIADDADAQDKPKPKPDTAIRNLGTAKLELASSANRKQFGLSGLELGKALQSEGFIPGAIKNLEKAALHISVSW